MDNSELIPTSEELLQSSAKTDIPEGGETLPEDVIEAGEPCSLSENGEDLAESELGEQDGEVAEDEEGEDAPHDESVLMRDLDELTAEFPELSSVARIEELLDPMRYAKLRDLGLTPREAYLATERRAARVDGRARMSGLAPRAARSPRVMSSYAVRCIRELFDGITDDEIISLYKRVAED